MNQSRADTSTKTNAQLLLQIVSAERDCPTCLGVGSLGMQMDEVGDKVAIKTLSLIPCFQCGSTGKAPILDPKLMRLPCTNPYCIAVLPEFIDSQNVGVCKVCGGRNWIPNPDAWDMKKALHLAGYQLVEEYDLIRRRWVAAVYRYVVNLGIAQIEGDADPARARFLAVVRAVISGIKGG